MWHGLELAPSPGRGFGVFASRPLPAGVLVPYGGVALTPEHATRLVARGRGSYVSWLGARLGCVDAHPHRLLPGQAFAWPGARLNEVRGRSPLLNPTLVGTDAFPPPWGVWGGLAPHQASLGELYNCRLVFWDRQSDSADQPAYPLASHVSRRVYAETMVPLAAGDELLASYTERASFRREYAVAPPPPLSTPEAWGAHLDPIEARVLRTQRLRAMAAAARASRV